MIDVKNYEGHNENIESWQKFANSLPRWAENADKKLVADAPKLLAKCKSLAGQLVATRAYLNDLVTFIKECELVEFCDKCDGFYLFEDGRQCDCCPSCVGEDYDADDNRTCRDCKIEFSERFYEY